MHPALLAVSSSWLVLVPLAYLLGALPFGWIFARVLKGEDIRRVGSGGTGATNTSRLLGRPMGVLIFLLDFGKGLLPVLLTRPRGTAAPLLDGVAGLELPPGDFWLPVLCGAAAAIGHCWPVYIGFRGGKAVATWCGAVTALDPLLFPLGGLVWLATLALTRWVGLASVLMGFGFAAIAVLRRSPAGYGWEVPIGTAAMAGLILLRHRANIARIRAGTEPRFGAKRGSAAPPVDATTDPRTEH